MTKASVVEDADSLGDFPNLRSRAREGHPQQLQCCVNRVFQHRSTGQLRYCGNCRAEYPIVLLELWSVEGENTPSVDRPTLLGNVDDGIRCPHCKEGNLRLGAPLRFCSACKQYSLIGRYPRASLRAYTVQSRDGEHRAWEDARCEEMHDFVRPNHARLVCLTEGCDRQDPARYRRDHRARSTLGGAREEMARASRTQRSAPEVKW